MINDFSLSPDICLYLQFYRKIFTLGASRENSVFEAEGRKE